MLITASVTYMEEYGKHDAWCRPAPTDPDESSDELETIVVGAVGSPLVYAIYNVK